LDHDSTTQPNFMDLLTQDYPYIDCPYIAANISIEAYVWYYARMYAATISAQTQNISVMCLQDTLHKGIMNPKCFCEPIVNNLSPFKTDTNTDTTDTDTN